MDVEEIEEKISDLEDAYSNIEDVVSSSFIFLGPTDLDKQKILEQILDGIQYFINELSLTQDSLMNEKENNY